MRRLLLAAVLTALLVGSFAGAASARLGDEPDEPVRVAAPFTAPVAAPRADGEHPEAYGFRSSAELAAALGGGAAPAASASSAPGSTSVTITATVLPVVTIVVGGDGAVRELVTNTPERDAAGVLYVVRSGSVDGDTASLTDATWADARHALGAATAGTGTVWTA